MYFIKRYKKISYIYNINKVFMKAMGLKNTETSAKLCHFIEDIKHQFTYAPVSFTLFFLNHS